MLSASTASLGEGAVGESMLMDDAAAGPPPWEPGMFAPPPQPTMEARRTDRPQGDFPPPFSSNAGDGPGMWNLKRGEPATGHSISSLGDRDSYNPADAFAPPPAVRYVIVITNGSTGSDVNSPPPLPGDRPRVAKATAPPAQQDDAAALGGSNDHYTKLPSSEAGDRGPVEFPGVPANRSAAPPAAALADGGGAAQSAARSAASAAQTSSPAVDVAFQAYAPHLLLLANTVPSETAASQEADEGARTDETVGDFIQPGESSDFQGDGRLDATAHERAAIDAVLDRLQDIGSLPMEDFAEIIIDPQLVDAATALLFENLALAENEGGMLLIDTGEDTVAAPTNAAVLAESAIQLPTLNGSVGSAIGFYQAIDVGGEEVWATEATQVVNPFAEAVDPARLEMRLSNDSGNRPRTAAAIVTASAFAGALLWTAQRKRGGDQRV